MAKKPIPPVQIPIIRPDEDGCPDGSEVGESGTDPPTQTVMVSTIVKKSTPTVLIQTMQIQMMMVSQTEKSSPQAQTRWLSVSIQLGNIKVADVPLSTATTRLDGHIGQSVWLTWNRRRQD